MDTIRQREPGTALGQPKFSVITVCFNSAQTIEQTIESVRSQVGTTFEHAIIDGGSTDGTLDILDRYRDGFSAVISEPDDGIYDAMQKGIRLAGGEFVGFLNADDRFASVNALAMLDHKLATGEWDGITAAVEQVNDAGKVIRILGRDPPTEDNILWGIVPPHPGMYLRADLVRSAGGFDKRLQIVGDFDLYLRARAAARLPFAHVPDVVVEMRVGGRSTSGLNSYLTSSMEFLSVLKARGYRPSPLQIHLRAFKKIPELFQGMVSAK